MKAVVLQGPYQVAVEEVPEPRRTARCGSAPPWEFLAWSSSVSVRQEGAVGTA